MTTATTTNGTAAMPSLPKNIAAEKSVLGAMLRENAIIADVVQHLDAADFYSASHRLVYQAAVDLWDEGQPVDAVTLATRLRDRGQVEDVGGYADIGDLLDAAPTAANAEYYARIVRDKALCRELFYGCQEIADGAKNPISPGVELLESAEKKIFAIADGRRQSSLVAAPAALIDFYQRVEERAASNGISGLPTGFADLDKILAGLQNAELIVIGARPSTGKTALGMALAAHAAIDENAPTLFVSLEQSQHEIWERLLCSRANVDSQRIRANRLTSDDHDRLIEAGPAIRSSSLFVDDGAGQTVLRIAATARRLKLRNGLRLLVVDYLQLVEPDNRRDSRQEQVANITRRLKSLAKELQIPVVALAQLNRQPEQRVGGKPRLSDLRESGGQEQDADTVILLHRADEEEYGPIRTIDVIIAKQRNGPIGEIKLAFRKECLRFENFAAEFPKAF